MADIQVQSLDKGDGYEAIAHAFPFNSIFLNFGCP
jgi:hypothetical protein